MKGFLFPSQTSCVLLGRSLLSLPHSLLLLNCAPRFCKRTRTQRWSQRWRKHPGHHTRGGGRSSKPCHNSLPPPCSATLLPRTSCKIKSCSVHGKTHRPPAWAGEGWWAEGSYMLTGQISGYLVASFVSASPLTSQEICSRFMFLRLLPLAQTA